MSKPEFACANLGGGRAILRFGIGIFPLWYLFRISDFGLRISHFGLRISRTARQPVAALWLWYTELMQTLTREQVRQVDRLAIEELGIPGVVLMENAGREVAMAVLDILEGDLHLVAQDATVSILCGPGNNAGDGYVAARHLANVNVKVTAFAACDPDKLTGDAAINYAIAQKMGLVVPVFTEEMLLEQTERIGEAHLFVDALLGTGFQGEVKAPMVEVIDVINASKERGALVVAVDVPSGFDCDKGTPSNATVHADVTVTFVAAKPGFANPEAELYVGRVIVGDIGAPPMLIARTG
jgi:NAD(P)H-hydrate epimerase